MGRRVDNRDQPARAVKMALAMIYYVVSAAVHWGRSLTGSTSAGTCVILMYHEVTERQRVRFARQIERLLRWAIPVAPEAEPSWPAGARCFAVTFDDAFQGLLQNALPILSRHRIPAAIFVPTGFLGARPRWLSDQEHPLYDQVVMTEEQIRSLDGSLISVGAHCVTHPRLPGLDDAAAAWELRTSKKCLEDITARPVTLFAFPYGALDERTLRLTRECGYQRAFAAQPMGPFETSDGFLFGRIGVSADDWPLEFWLKVHGAYRWSPIASKAKRWMYRTRRWQRDAPLVPRSGR